jgi:hypothetical protein
MESGSLRCNSAIPSGDRSKGNRMRAPLAVLLVLAASPGFAATEAFDRANNLAYLDGFQVGDNGGTGWGGDWEFHGLGTPTIDLGTSTNNGDGDTDGDGDIDTANVAWEVYASGIAAAGMSRDFDGELDIRQVFSADLDAVPHPDPYVAGVQMVHNLHMCVELRWHGNDAEFMVVDADGFFVFPLAVTDEGIHVEYEQTGPTSYTLRVNALGGPVVQRDGVQEAACLPNGVFFYVEGDGSANTRRLFFNRIRVPEPAPTAASYAAAFAPLAALRRRRAGRAARS